MAVRPNWALDLELWIEVFRPLTCLRQHDQRKYTSSYKPSKQSTRELFMNTKSFAIVALIAAFAPISAFAQQQQQQPKASKAEVQKVVDSIKGDKAKLAKYCSFVKLDDQFEQAAQKNQKDPKLQSLGQELAESIKKVGPDFEKIMNSELDEASSGLLEGLGKSCQ
jgi:hypothetical protein